MSRITLESALAGDFSGMYSGGYETEGTLEELQAECSDLLVDMGDCLTNIVVLEAAKKIKASKSKKKKVKVKKTKTTAKAARASKKSGKRVRREEDDIAADEVNGIQSDVPEGDVSEDDLETMPDNAQVTEIEPDSSDAGVETDEDETTEEGYMISFEDASILAFEDKKTVEKSRFRKFWEKWVDKIVDFFKSVIRRIQSWLSVDRRMLDKIDKETYAKNIQSEKTKVKCRRFKKSPNTIMAELKKVFDENFAAMTSASKPGKLKIFGKEIDELNIDELSKVLNTELFGDAKAEPTEMTLKEAASVLGGKDELRQFLIDTPKDFDDHFQKINRLKRDTKWEIKNNGEEKDVSDHLTYLKDRAKQLQKLTTLSLKYHKMCRADVRTVLAKAGEVDPKEFAAPEDKK